MIIEGACVLPFILGGIVGSTFGSAIAATMWFFDTMDLVEALDQAKSRGVPLPEKKRTYIYRNRVRHIGYGLEITEIRI